MSDTPKWKCPRCPCGSYVAVYAAQIGHSCQPGSPCVPKGSPGGRKPDPLKQDAMAAMRRSGSTLQAIADQYGITKQAVDYLLAARKRRLVGNPRIVG
jgi:hypothetical protein